MSPDYAAAYAGLSRALQQPGGFGAADPEEVESPARAAALKAIELDEQGAEGHIALGVLKYLYDWDWIGSEKELRRALELDPGNLDAHINYGQVLMFVGRHDEAIREGQTAVHLDPLSASSHAAVGWFLFKARRFDDALRHLRRAMELEPRSVVANARLGIVYTETGRYDEAIATFERHGELAPGAGDLIQAGIARVYALMGRTREARKMISGLKASSFNIAAAYAALGDKDEAFNILDKAIERREPIVALQTDRDRELTALRAGFESARAGRGRVLFLEGEPGIGKTMVVEIFLRDLARSGARHLAARGRCSERLAGSEAYLPIEPSDEGRRARVVHAGRSIDANGRGAGQALEGGPVSQERLNGIRVKLPGGARGITGVEPLKSVSPWSAGG
jgi:tetratricopeptide (TPR) repeat protein